MSHSIEKYTYKQVEIYQVDNQKEIEEHQNTNLILFGYYAYADANQCAKITQNISFQGGYYSSIDPLIVLMMCELLGNASHFSIVLVQILNEYQQNIDCKIDLIPKNIDRYFKTLPTQIVSLLSEVKFHQRNFEKLRIQSKAIYKI